MRAFAAAAVLLLAAAAGATVPAAEDVARTPQTRSQANMNDYFDSLTGQISQFFILNGLDPMPLPDQESGFSVKDLIGIRWHGELELTKGWMINLSHLVRRNDATLSYDHKLLDVRFELRFDSVQMSYDFRAQIMNIGPKGSVIGKLKKLQILIDFIVDIETLDIYVQDVHFTNTGRLTLHVESAGLLDFITNGIINTVTLIFKGLIVDVVEVAVRSAFENTLENLHLGDYILGGKRN
ncbi:hypothetical protein R5R35_005822 [Gryllus longicercus]|uniref:Accessory gland protein n=1 Tax=Gryllus longicercus TaxID=2509291 RepID=A0AAN9Z0W8_9ORTH